MLLTIITPTIGKGITNVLKNPEAKKKGHKINRMIPKIPNFDNKAAGNKLIRVLASQCTSGNRQNSGYTGIFTQNGIIINKEDKHQSPSTENKGAKIKVKLPTPENIKGKKEVLIL